MTGLADNPHAGRPSALNQLLAELRRLYRTAGEPSSRRIAQLTGRAISHTTVIKVIRGDQRPKWGPLEVIVIALGGDVEHFRVLWVRACESADDSKPTEQQKGLNSDEADSEASGPTTGQVDAKDRTLFAIRSNIPNLDSLIGGGFGPSQLIVIGGEHSVGKSMLGLGFARASAIDQQVPTLIVTLEGTREDVLTRALSAEARIQLHLLRSGALSDDDWKKLAAVSGHISEAPLFLTDSCHSLDATLEEIEEVVAEKGVRLVVVDYLQQLLSGDDNAAKQEKVQLLRSFKRLAAKLHVAIVVVAQIDDMPGRLNSTFVDHLNLPQLPELMSDTDLVLLLHREDLYDPLSLRLGEADLIAIKNRNGPRDIIALAAQVHLCRFVDLGPPGQNQH